MHYRLGVSADVLLRRFLFHSKKTQENFNILESRDSTDQITLPIKKLDDLKLANQKTSPIKKPPDRFWYADIEFSLCFPAFKLDKYQASAMSFLSTLKSKAAFIKALVYSVLGDENTSSAGPCSTI